MYSNTDTQKWIKIVITDTCEEWPLEASNTDTDSSKLWINPWALGSVDLRTGLQVAKNHTWCIITDYMILYVCLYQIHNLLDLTHTTCVITHLWSSMYGFQPPVKTEIGWLSTLDSCPHWASGVDLRAVGVVHGGLHQIFLAERFWLLGMSPISSSHGMPWNKDI